MGLAGIQGLPRGMGNQGGRGSPSVQVLDIAAEGVPSGTVGKLDQNVSPMHSIKYSWVLVQPWMLDACLQRHRMLA